MVGKIETGIKEKQHKKHSKRTGLSYSITQTNQTQEHVRCGWQITAHASFLLTRFAGVGMHGDGDGVAAHRDELT